MTEILRKKRISKKRKSAWRKTDIRDVEEFLELQREDERIGYELSCSSFVFYPCFSQCFSLINLRYNEIVALLRRVTRSCSRWTMAAKP